MYLDLVVGLAELHQGCRGDRLQRLAGGIGNQVNMWPGGLRHEPAGAVNSVDKGDKRHFVPRTANFMTARCLSSNQTVTGDRKSVGVGQRVSVSGDIWGCSIYYTKKNKNNKT